MINETSRTSERYYKDNGIDVYELLSKTVEQMEELYLHHFQMNEEILKLKNKE